MHKFVLAALLLALSFPVHAQQPTKILRIGYLDSSTASGSAVLVNAFRQELSKLGWIEGKNINIEYRFAEQKNERLPELARDLVRLKVELIVVSGTAPALAAKSATTTIPIVMTNIGDPVGAGLVASLARPGGNVTGLSSLSPELNTKRLEVLKDTVPNLARVGLLWLGGGVPTEFQLKELRPAAVATLPTTAADSRPISVPEHCKGVDPNNVDRLRQVENIATDLNLISGPVLGDGPTSIFRMVESDFCHLVVM